MKHITLLLAFSFPVVVSAQYLGQIEENGVWMNPTTQSAMDILMGRKVGPENSQPSEAAVAVLRQMYEPFSSAELDAFADELARIILEEESLSLAQRAKSALLGAAEPASETPFGGTPYEKSLEILMEVHQKLIDVDAKDYDQYRVRSVLSTMILLGGEAYVRNLFESSEPPKQACYRVAGPEQLPEGERPPKDQWCPLKSDWCIAGDVLISRNIDGAPDKKSLYLNCLGIIVNDDGSMSIIKY